MNIYLSHQLKKADAYTMKNEPISSIELMERAALKCAHWIEKHIATSTTIQVICGCGNNGGDGLAIACMLFDFDYTINIVVLEIGKPSVNNIANLKKCTSKNIPTQFLNETNYLDFQPTSHLIIDAIFGYGLNKPITGWIKTIFQQINISEKQLIAIDIPSGLSADFDSFESIYIEATTSLTFQYPKLPFFIHEISPNHHFEVLDIGLSQTFEKDEKTPYTNFDIQRAQQIIKHYASAAHKGTFGHGLIIGGSEGKFGAPVLSSFGALRSGIGLLTVQLPQNGIKIMHENLLEVMSISDANPAYISQNIDYSKFNAIAIGPGLGTENTTKEVLISLLKNYTKPIIIDADGLNLLASIEDWKTYMHKNIILTPHPGEFKRLFPTTTTRKEQIEAQLNLSVKTGVTIVLKGQYTCISNKHGELSFNSSGNNGLATAGSGDVLTGIILGFCAQGYSPSDAACLAVYLHGKTAENYALKNAQQSMIASDIYSRLGIVMNDILQN